ncbi:hypothetical protein [Candidatus Curculioniphilus buchneri]|uniref:hypothetical protein n=1 Tax=Candidatus Curculioniphilus buchneri TaxID=690594 RepID=UPI00376F28EC
MEDIICTKVKNQIFDALLNNNEISVPTSLINNEINILKTSETQQFNNLIIVKEQLWNYQVNYLKKKLNVVLKLHCFRCSNPKI